MLREQSDNRAKRDREAIARAERLLNIGFWEFDPATSAFTWYPEARRLLGIDTRTRSSADGRIRSWRACRSEILRATSARRPLSTPSASAEDDGTEQQFEALGEIRAAGDGPSFGFIRKVYGADRGLSGSPDEDLLTELPSRRALGIRLSDIAS